MSKMIQALLVGMLSTFILDFFVFLGIKLHYIDSNNIKEYYNVLFADHQNVFVFFAFSILLGYIIMYRSNKFSVFVFGVLSLFSLSTLISPIGELVGKTMLGKSNVSIQTQKYSYTGDIIYVSRKNVLLYDYGIKKIIYIDKNKIIGKY